MLQTGEKSSTQSMGVTLYMLVNLDSHFPEAAQ